MENYRKRPSRLRGLLIGAFVGLLILGAGTEVYIGYQLYNSNPKVLGTNATQTTVIDKLTLATKPGLQSFISQKYGYGFYYQPYIVNSDGSRSNLNVEELSDGTVIAYNDQDKKPFRIAQGFLKDPKDSLDDAIKELILKGRAPAGCKIDDSAGLDDNNLSQNLDQARFISTTQQPTSTASTTSQIPCPTTYLDNEDSLHRFFLMEPSHPGSFVFIEDHLKLNLTSHTDQNNPISWFDSITFLK